MPTTQKKMIYRYTGKNWKIYQNISTSQVVGTGIFFSLFLSFFSIFLFYIFLSIFKKINPKDLHFKAIFQGDKS